MKKLAYSDVYMVPQKGRVESRQQVDTSWTVSASTKKFKFRIPVIPSNMACVIDSNIAAYLSENDYMYIMHRFGHDQYEFIRKMNFQDRKLVSVSVGAKQSDIDLVRKVFDNGLRIDFLTIDIAHGHSVVMEDTATKLVSLMKKYEKETMLIGGNVATAEGLVFLYELGLYGGKIGIGGGSVCSTKNKTGFTYPMYSCVKDATDGFNSEISFDHFHPFIIIADGGVKEHGDIAKALNAGADAVMAGGLFASLVDSPAESVDGRKIYYGSASEHNKGEYKHVEGVRRMINLEPMTYEQKLNEIREDLASAISYAGGKRVDDLKYARVIEV